MAELARGEVAGAPAAGEATMSCALRRPTSLTASASYAESARCVLFDGTALSCRRPHLSRTALHADHV